MHLRGQAVTAPTTNDTRALADMPLFDNATLKCPYHFDRTLRDSAPVYRDPQSGIYTITTFEDGVTLTMSPKRTFTSA